MVIQIISFHYPKNNTASSAVYTCYHVNVLKGDQFRKCHWIEFIYSVSLIFTFVVMMDSVLFLKNVYSKYLDQISYTSYF